MYTVIANVETNNSFCIRVYEKAVRGKKYKGRKMVSDGVLGDISDGAPRKAGKILKEVFPEFPGFVVDTGIRKVSYSKLTKVIAGHLLHWVAFSVLNN